MRIIVVAFCRVVTLSLIPLLISCTNSLNEDDQWVEHQDPFEGINRIFFGFNDVVIKNVLGPAADLYDEKAPDPIKTCIRNTRNNLAEPVRLVAHAATGDWMNSYAAGFRFVANTFLGGVGCIDVATDGFQVASTDTDIGLSLRSYFESQQTVYVVLPLFGPSTPADAIGSLAAIQLDPRTMTVGGNSVLNPYNAYSPFWLDGNCDCVLPVLNTLDVAGSEYLPAIRVVEEVAFDPYSFVRDAYLERRATLATEIRGR